MKEERNKSQLKPENQLFDPCEPLGTVLQKQTKAISKQWHGHLEMRKAAFLGPTLNTSYAYRGTRFPPRESGVVLTHIPKMDPGGPMAVSRETWHLEQETGALKPEERCGALAMTRGTSPSGGSKGDETPIVSGWPNLCRKKLLEGVWKTKVNHAFTNSTGGKTWLGASLSEPWLREEKWWVW